MKKRLCILLALTMLLCCGCGGPARELTTPGCPTAPPGTDPADYGPLLGDFGLALLGEIPEAEENILLSPFSILTALAMTANGAAGETRSQMEALLGADCAGLNDFVSGYAASLPGGEDSGVQLANSIWIRDVPSLRVEEAFLKLSEEYYGAGVFQAPFDGGTLRQINGWVEEHTGGRIRDMLDEIPADAMLYLVNALTFDGGWHDIYEPHQVQPAPFTTGDGRQITVPMMYSTEHHYLETEQATGFLKYYDGYRYAFAALLPAEGVTPAQLARSLTGESLRALLEQPQDILVHAGLPTFETEYACDLRQILISLGMEQAFSPEEADFTDLAQSEENLCIGRVLHKTFLRVDQLGTQAGAATMVEVRAGGTRIDDSRTVILDRPFLYLIIDCQWNQPLFMGILNDPGC